MTAIGGVGQGVVLQLSGDTIVARVRSVQLPEWLMEAVDFSGLESAPWMKFLPGGLSDPGLFNAELFMDTEIDPVTIGLVQTATFTFPIQNNANGTPATLIGSGFITSLAFPGAAINEPLIQPISFKYDGIGTVPAFSKEAT